MADLWMSRQCNATLANTRLAPVTLGAITPILLIADGVVLVLPVYQVLVTMDGQVMGGRAFDRGGRYGRYRDTG